ncbi:alpha/beta hydrolase [Lysinibacillus sphaericus]|uniref:alpha/beta hydrolase n=1 Tax=Lysinibacillus sphaericus TaxID=1421 RepID=UPI003CFE2F64
MKKGFDFVIKILPAKEIYLKGNHHAVLLLHSFTSHTRDMKKVATDLHQKGFTCYAPLYRGHGYNPEPLIQYKVNDWWEDVVTAYRFLLEEGFQTISVVGLSIGGIFALKLAELENIERVIVLSVPVDRQPERLKERLIKYAFNYKKLEGKSFSQISQELEVFYQMSLEAFNEFQQFIRTTIQNLHKITIPIAIFYGELDDELYMTSAHTIFKNVNSQVKRLKGFTQSKHLMTLGRDQQEIDNDILDFLTI